MAETRPQPPGLYGSRLIPAVFDFMVSWIYWPTPSGVIRERIVDHLELAAGVTVVEIGSGTGGITEHMIRRGARVTCVDRSEPMLARARQRVPEAHFVLASALDWKSDERFERVLLALFLHEQDAADRVAILRRARAALGPEGRLVVADVSSPERGLARTLWRGFLRSFEPATVLEVADGALEAEILEAGFEILASESLAGGRARLWSARLR